MSGRTTVVSAGTTVVGNARERDKTRFLPLCIKLRANPMKQMGPGQHKASLSLVAYVQDGLDLENLKSLLHLLCDSAICYQLQGFVLQKNPTYSTGNRCATVPGVPY